MPRAGVTSWPKSMAGLRVSLDHARGGRKGDAGLSVGNERAFMDASAPGAYDPRARGGGEVPRGASLSSLGHPARLSVTFRFGLYPNFFGVRNRIARQLFVVANRIVNHYVTFLHMIRLIYAGWRW